MRVLHVTGTFLPVKGGGPYYVHYLSKQLEAAGHTCRVVTTDAGGTPEIETVPTNRARSVSVAGAPIAPTFPRTLHRAVSAFDPDVIHANYPLPFYPDMAAVLGRLTGVPVVLTCHGAFEMSLDSVVGAVGTVYNNTLLRGTLRLADRVHVSNRGILETFDFYRQHEAKTSVIPIGVNTEWFDPTTVDGPAPYRTDSTEKTVLYVGSFRRYKGLLNLMEAFAQVNEKADVQLVMVGDGPERQRLVHIAEDHNLTDSVQFVGHVDDHALRRAYAHADVFVLPSPTIRESLGMVAMEAMAMEVPTVVTAGSGIGNVLAGEDAAEVVKPDCPDAIADALTDLLIDEAEAKAAGAAGRELIESKFAWKSVVEEYEEMYNTVV
jgi:glycosyltransferase involved in cell wall biosynthesis